MKVHIYLFVLLVCVSFVSAITVIFSVFGTLVWGNTVLSGSDFGVKDPVAPLHWENWDYAGVSDASVYNMQIIARFRFLKMFGITII